MFPLSTKKALATALAGAALASSLGASAAPAAPVEQFIPGSDAGGSSYVPPPPSSIAASAEKDYKRLRDPAYEPPPASTGDKYQDLRSPDTRDAAEGYSPTLEAHPAAAEPSPSDGFDLVSAAIGAAAGTGLVIVLLAAGGLARRGSPTRRQRPAGA